MCADLGREVLAQHDGHQVEKAGAGPGVPAVDASSCESVAGPEFVQQGRLGRPGGSCPPCGVVGSVQVSCQGGEFVQLEDEEGGQVRGDDHAFGVERGGVVPAAVVAVVVVGECRAGGASGGEPEGRPALQPVVCAFQFRAVGGCGQAAAQVAQCPAVDGRFDEVVQDLGVGDRVGERPGLVLVVEGKLVLVPGQSGAAGGQGQGVEAVVPAPDLVHPVLGHQDGGPGDQARRAYGRGPHDVGGEFGGRAGRGAPGGHRVDEVREGVLRRFDDLAEE